MAGEMDVPREDGATVDKPDGNKDSTGKMTGFFVGVPSVVDGKRIGMLGDDAGDHAGESPL